MERTNGELYNIEPNLLNRTAVEQVDDYMMKIYEIIKHAFPDMVGYTADCHEGINEEGEFDVHTRFFMHRAEDENETAQELKA